MQKALRSILVAGLLAAVVAIGAVILATSPVRRRRLAERTSRSTSPVTTHRCSTRISPSVWAAPTSASTSASRSPTARAWRRDTWTASKLTMPEHQCKPHPSDYSPRGPANLRIWEDIDTASQQLIAFHTHISWQAPERTIWMDGRPHPPAYAAHTWQGFSTGRFDGDNLVITTTHLKTGWIRRNGIPRSDLATVTETLDAVTTTC